MHISTLRFGTRPSSEQPVNPPQQTVYLLLYVHTDTNFGWVLVNAAYVSVFIKAKTEAAF